MTRRTEEKLPEDPFWRIVGLVLFFIFVLIYLGPILDAS